MDYIPVPDVAQLELICTLEGQRCETVLHYYNPAPWTASRLTSLAAAAKTKWQTYIKPHVTTTLSLVAVRAVDLAAQNGPAVEYGTGLPITGDVATGALPNNCAMVVTKRTANRGRSFRGRIYHYPLTEAQVTGNAVVPASAAAYVTAWGNFLTLNLAASDDGIMVVVSRHTGGNPRVTGISTPVINLTTDAIVDSQRRRLPGRGA